MSVPHHVSNSRRDLTDPTLYFNREASWLEFNQRVLDQALDEFHPLLVGLRLRHHVRRVVLETYLRDTERAYVVAGDRYERVRSGQQDGGVSAQEALLAWYTSAAAEPEEG